MIFIILIFLIAIITAFGMLAFRTWELRTGKVSMQINDEQIIPQFSFRKFEKAVLYFAKHILQYIVLGIVKYWFIGFAKTKKWLAEKWPKIHIRLFDKKVIEVSDKKPSFIQKAIIESKVKIKVLKQKIHAEHEIK